MAILKVFYSYSCFLEISKIHSNFVILPRDITLLVVGSPVLV